jgi:hypothetical protein
MAVQDEAGVPVAARAVVGEEIVVRAGPRVGRGVEQPGGPVTRRDIVDDLVVIYPGQLG